MRVDEPSNYALSGTGQSALVAQVTSTFPSTSAPAIVVASWPSARRQAAEHEAARLEHLAAAAGIAHPPFQVSAAPDRDAGALALPLTGLGDNAASRDAVRLLRDRLIPSTLGRVAGVRTAVTGDAAQDVDFTAQMRHGLPFVVAFVLVLAFGLLLVTFRSIVVPLTAIALNLLSVAAAYGVLVLVFQHGWAQGLLGFHSSAAIVSWLPLFLFVVLFGLSMDYHVFILSRVREGVDAGLGNDDALRHGITRNRGCRHQRGAGDGGRVLAVRHRPRARPQAGRSRSRRRRAAGRHRDPRGAAPGHHEAAGRAQLVPAPRAGLAAPRPRRVGPPQ